MIISQDHFIKTVTTDFHNNKIIGFKTQILAPPYAFCKFDYYSCDSGNLLNRTLGLLKKNCQSTLVADSSVAAEGSDFKDTVEKLVRFITQVSQLLVLK